MTAYKRKTEPKKSAASKKSFAELMRLIPGGQFTRMVSKCGLPTDEARAVCKAFMENKK